MMKYLGNPLQAHLKPVTVALVLFCSISTASSQERISDILLADDYKLTFEYKFGAHTTPQDLDGSTVWDQNLWYRGKNDPANIVKHNDYISLLTPTFSEKRMANTELTTWSRAKKAPLVKVHYGYFEARMKFNSNANNWPAFWLLSDNLPLLPQGADHQAIGEWCEIDVYEGSTAGIFSGNVHHWTGHHSDELQKQHFPVPAGTDFSKWNDFGALWTKDTIKYFLNGNLILAAPTPKVCQDNSGFLILSSQARDGSAGPGQVDIARVKVYTND